MANFLIVFGGIYTVITVLGSIGGAITMWALFPGDSEMIGYGIGVLVGGILVNLAVGFTFITVGKTSETVDNIYTVLNFKSKKDSDSNKNITDMLEAISANTKEKKSEDTNDFVIMKCLSCGGDITVIKKELKAGKSVKCPKCGKEFFIKKNY